MKVAIICCLHGNERFSLEIAKKFESFIPFFVANEKALKENKRFIESDLNRSFPGKEDGNYEERLAHELLKRLENFDYIVDLHSSSNTCPLFGIITKPNQEKIEFAKRLGLKRLVIMPDSFASGKALIDFVKCGISIEIGPHERKENIDEVEEIIKNLLEEREIEENLEIFEVIGLIKKEQENVAIENFRDVTKGEIIAKGKVNQIADFDFTPVLVNEESYKDILCLACKKVDSEKFYKHLFF